MRRSIFRMAGRLRSNSLDVLQPGYGPIYQKACEGDASASESVLACFAGQPLSNRKMCDYSEGMKSWRAYQRADIFPGLGATKGMNSDFYIGNHPMKFNDLQLNPERYGTYMGAYFLVI